MKPILTQRQLRKLDELKGLQVVFLGERSFPSLVGNRVGWVRVGIDARDLFVEYAPTLRGTWIKNISTRMRDYYDFILYNRDCTGEIYIDDDCLRDYENHLKNDLKNSKGNILVKMSHIRAVFKWCCENKKIDLSWWLKYKVRGKPFQKKESKPTPTLPIVDPRRCLPYIEEVEQPKTPQPKKKRGNPFRKCFLYDLLGVAPTATTEEIKRGYKRRMVALHPDHHMNDEIYNNLHNLSQGVNLAFEYLTQHREAYDGYCTTTKGYEEAAYKCKEIYILVGGYPSLYKLENRI